MRALGLMIFKGDGLGEIQGAYGPYFIRLRVPSAKGIGIHGTHDNNSLGKRASEGCIRMENAQLEKLVDRLSPQSLVIITPGCADIIADSIGRENFIRSYLYPQTKEKK